MIATIRFVVLTARRDRFVLALLAMLIVSTALSVFLGGTALIEQWSMAVVFAAGAGRAVLALGMVVFVAFHIQRMFETKEVEAILARSLSRTRFVLAYWLGFAVLTTFFVGVFSALLVMTAPSPLGAVLWGCTVLAEGLIITAVAVFAGVMLERATSVVLFTLGFYVLARLIGFFVGISQLSPRVGELGRLLDHAMNFIVVIVPRFDLFAQTNWLIYGPRDADILFFVLQSGIFLALVLSAAVFDLRRRQF
jgi:hypothetical protein